MRNYFKKILPLFVVCLIVLFKTGDLVAAESVSQNNTQYSVTGSVKNGVKT